METNESMAGADAPGSGDQADRADRKHWFQRLLDNPWLLLALGLLLPILSYTVWGWIELALMPEATLP